MAPKIQKKEASKPKVKTNGNPRESGVLKRSESWTINRYLLKVTGKARTSARAKKPRDVSSLQERLNTIDAILAKGTKTWSVPAGRVAKGEKRQSVEKEIPLRPTEIAKLLAKKMNLSTRIASGGRNAGRKSTQTFEALREAFLSVLPGWAKRHGHSVELLRVLHIPEEDLIECGLVAAPVEVPDGDQQIADF